MNLKCTIYIIKVLNEKLLNILYDVLDTPSKFYLMVNWPIQFKLKQLECTVKQSLKVMWIWKYFICKPKVVHLKSSNYLEGLFWLANPQISKDKYKG